MSGDNKRVWLWQFVWRSKPRRWIWLTEEEWSNWWTGMWQGQGSQESKGWMMRQERTALSKRMKLASIWSRCVCNLTATWLVTWQQTQAGVTIWRGIICSMNHNRLAALLTAAVTTANLNPSDLTALEDSFVPCEAALLLRTSLEKIKQKGKWGGGKKKTKK